MKLPFQDRRREYYNFVRNGYGGVPDSMVKEFTADIIAAERFGADVRYGTVDHGGTAWTPAEMKAIFPNAREVVNRKLALEGEGKIGRPKSKLQAHFDKERRGTK